MRLPNYMENVLMSSASMNKSSGSQFVRITNGIQLEPETFHRARLIMIFLANLGIAKIL